MIYAIQKNHAKTLYRYDADRLRKVLMEANPWMRVVREVIPWHHGQTGARQYRLLIFDPDLPSSKTFYGYFAGGDPEKPLGRRKKA